MFVNQHTSIANSDKNFTIPPSTLAETVPLSQVQKLPKHTRITVEVKVRSVTEPKYIDSKKLKLQELVVADSSGAVRLSIWENEIGSMEQAESYHIENVTIREYSGQRFISTSPQKSEIIPIEDIGPVDADLDVKMAESSTSLKVAEDEEMGKC